MPTVALYARVSTAQQEEEATIDSQVAALEGYAQQNGYRLLPELYFLDQAVSGTRLDRPALDCLRDMAAEGQFSTVLCLSPDRLARCYAHQCVLLDELRRSNVRVIFVNQPVADDPQGQLLLGIQGVFAEYEHAQILERLRRGRLHRIRQGELATPQVPYGYRYIPVREPGGGRWEIHFHEAEVVRQIYAWYTGEEAPTMYAIVQRLQALGPLAVPRGNQWTYSTVRAILKHPGYCGQAFYNRTRQCSETVGRPREIGRGRRTRPSRELRPREEWIPFTVPALIDEQMYQRAQERLAMNAQFSRRNSRQRYLLRSLLVCDVCGHAMVGRTTSPGVQQYYCEHGGKNRSSDVPPHSRGVAAKTIEPLVWKAVTQLLREPALLADAWHSEGEFPKADLDEVSRLESRLRAVQQEWERLLDAYQEGLLDKTALAQRKERLDQQRQALQKRIEHLNCELRREQAKTRMIESFAQFCQTVEQNLDDPTPEVQQEVIRLLIDHIVVGEDSITIKHIIPTDGDCRLIPGRK